MFFDVSVLKGNLYNRQKIVLTRVLIVPSGGDFLIGYTGIDALGQYIAKMTAYRLVIDKV
ncbi:hypothetical protein GCM10017764_29450 [Sphingobacterium griseoflavum]|uniref:Uncharacterized protein n=1 Tax=Sphingobacterium griseoflavum TaxID=1474952 RepID=A0ABQ3I2M6_9SPHI|nr:hypothetical protein GCM10017764_29450 [Sphingobacterium griseoflavum]